MNKLTRSSLLVGIFVLGLMGVMYGQTPNRQKVDHTVSILEKRKTPERYQPKPQTAQNKRSKNPIRAKATLREEIKTLERQIAAMKGRPILIEFDKRKLARLEKMLSEKAKKSSK